MNLGKDIEHGGYPTSETRTITQKRRDANIYAGIGIKKRYADTKKGVDTSHTRKVECSQLPDTAISQQTDNRSLTMTLTFKGLNKSGRDAIYTGATRPIRFSLKLFVDGQAPASVEIDANFIAPKVRMSKEQRAAERANKPKPTEAERIARAEAKLADRKAKLAVAEQPAL